MNQHLQYKLSADANGNQLEGGKEYRFHLPANIPASKFWSIILYDSQDQFMLRTDQPWPSVHSQRSRLLRNEDGSVDAYFGPNTIPGKEYNWIKTIPGKGWFMVLRLYDTLETPLNISWVPDQIYCLSAPSVNQGD